MVAQSQTDFSPLWDIFTSSSDLLLSYALDLPQTLNTLLSSFQRFSQASAVAFWEYSPLKGWAEEVVTPSAPSHFSVEERIRLVHHLEQEEDREDSWQWLDLGRYRVHFHKLWIPLRFNPQVGFRKKEQRQVLERPPMKVFGALVFYFPEQQKGQNIPAPFWAMASTLSRFILLQWTLVKKAALDPLSGLYHRNFFEEILEEELSHATSHSLPLTLLMVDIDRLERLNERWGRLRGDRFLQNFSQRLLSLLRASDVCCRYGGDEFLVLLSQTGHSGAQKVVQKLLRHLSEKVEDCQLSLSIGGVCVEGDTNLSVEELITRADQALYEAKKQGGNRAIFWRKELAEASQRTDKLAGIFTANVAESYENVLALLRLILQTGSVSELKEFFDRACSAVLSLLQAHYVLFYLPEQGGLVFRAGRDWRGKKLRFGAKNWQEWVEKTLLEGRPQLFSEDKGSAFELVARAGMALPLTAGSHKLGVLCVVRREDRPFSSSEQALALGVSDALAVSLSQLLWREELIRLKERQEEQLAQLQEEREILLGEEKRLQQKIAHLEELCRQKDRQLQQMQKKLEGEYSLDQVVGKSKAMQEVFQLVEKVAGTDVPVLIVGASGTGKELIARAIHYRSHRRQGPLVVENCSAISEALLESELFGHKRGAFTGAHSDKVGLLEEAHGGTLFLDEVGEMPLSLQVKLLRVLQEKRVRPLGSTEWREVDFRLVTTTRYDLRRLVQEGRFREDLYYRISTVTIELPELRERKEDIPLLVEHFLKKFSQETAQPLKKLHPLALEMLLEYEWPGNVRELENEIKRLLVFSEEVVGPEHLSPQIRSRTNSLLTLVPTEKLTWKQARQFFERHFLEWQLKQHNYNVSQTAKSLGLTRQHLHRLMDLYRLSSKRKRKA